MAILAECPACRKKQSAKNKKCKCGENLDKAKRSKRVKYYIDYRIPGGKHRREYVGSYEGLNGYSIEDARKARDKVNTLKNENRHRLLDIKYESKMTFNELTQWYLEQAKVKNLKSYDRIKLALKNFNSVFGEHRLMDIKQTDLEEYQIKRQEEGRADATIDMEIKAAQTAVKKADDNIDFEKNYLKPFQKTDRLLKRGSNVRKTTISIEQFISLINHASKHYRAVLIIAFNTGMRLGEIKALKWSHIERENNMIRLPKELTKEKNIKNIPINQNVNDALKNLPRALHDDHVITYNGKPLSNKFSLKKQFSETCKKANIPYGRKPLNGITFHDIRRTVKTNMAAAGLSKVYRDTILGHSLRGMDIHYIVPSEEDLTKAMDQYTAWLDQKVASAIVDQNVDQKSQKK